ncbi:zinc finger protein, putative [Plasmodium berghei]|uniref:DNL-type zinc finger protein, putative n=2 Tax=Plasmodium berghei TaxID=5821 RepID=A0A509AJW7_PLABA|nr:DNL-type zinc finger protein, putative [Plasmodium berghei ANKA]CXI53450.1 zinc finger protein, putative [Plasmodium berghei]SCL94803.1 zinc finger protein, putative [Plasmodium berghei]SCM16104.1 zinc finger protein, putative [Plasmodium berghei]SCM17900.1 zinc finger protein, putative [Plasmodium berghei]SCN26231.1 zinc finger protein, putative [Plasmodium berghei]|eukprot:XP_034422028.1 DNL-type zinc finger protein, putative [Plasmodium berghei ANKA]
MVQTILSNLLKVPISTCLNNNLIPKRVNYDIKKLIYLFKKQQYGSYTIISQFPFDKNVQRIKKYNNIVFTNPKNNYSTKNIYKENKNCKNEQPHNNIGSTVFNKNSQNKINSSDNNNKNETTDIINVSSKHLDEHGVCETETNEQTSMENEKKKNKEYMVLMFTCKICEKKSAKKFSKQAYNNGVVIIRCPQCSNLHLISDQLGWFQDGKTNIEQIIQEKGEKVIKKFSYNNLLEIDDLLNAYK